MSLVDPNLLQLIGLGITGDDDLPDGRHLRWIFNRRLGFPRSGFALSRRPSLLGIDFDAPPPGTPAIRAQLTRRAELGAGPRIRFASGLSVAKSGGFLFGPALSGGQPLIRIDDRPLALLFGAEGASVPPSGPAHSNPAAYVLLTIVRRSRTGFVVARGSYNARPALRRVDEAAVGGDLRARLPALAGAVVDVGGVDRVLSSAERLTGPQAALRRDATIAAGLSRRGLRPTALQPPLLSDRNPFVTQTLLLHGGLLEHVELRGHDAHLLQVRWITSRDLLAARDWTLLERFHLPLTDAPELYPAWTPMAGEDVAAQRLKRAPPRRQAPWDRESGGDPPVLLAAVATPVLDSLAARYLKAEFEPVDAAMRQFLRGELTEIVPQCEVRVSERLEPEAGDATGPEPLDVTLSPFDMLLGAAADPQVARLLGLSTVDAVDPPGLYDYAIAAGFPLVWVESVLQPATGRKRADGLRGELAGKPAEWKGSKAFAPFEIASLLTGLRMQPAATLQPPAGLRAEAIPDATRKPVQARMRISWDRGSDNLFSDPQRLRVLHVFRRVEPGGDVLLHHRDDESKLLAPHLPTPYGAPDPRLGLVDRQVDRYAVHTWKITAMDLFGRLSPDAVISAELRDTLPPPPPANVELALLGDATQGPAWTELRASFDWLPAQASQAPDLARFDLHLRQGAIDPLAASQPASWGRFEHLPGIVAGPVAVAWPSLAVSGAPAGAMLRVDGVPLPEGGTRVTIAITPIVSPFDTLGQARLALAVQAIDEAGNAGAFAVGRAERVDLSVPPPPSFAAAAQRATAPDAQNRSWFAVPIPAAGDARARVLRTSAVALLAAAGADRAAFDALPEPQQVDLLRRLAALHREPFASDHEQPIPATGASHAIELVGSDRGLTVVYVAMENRNGTRTAWPVDPGPFLVVRVPRDATPPVPLVAELRVGDRSVTLGIARDVTGRARGLAVFRTRSAADAVDIRRMKLVAELAVPSAVEIIPITDQGLFDEVEYFYRVVAIGEGGERSPPTIVIGATPVSHGPPPAPEIRTIDRDAADPARRRVRLALARRDYPIFLLRRRRLAPAWEPATGVPLGADGSLDLAALAPTRDGAGYSVVIDDAVPQPGEPYAYVARTEDRRGRSATGTPLMEPS